jgi:hypothetical protein
VVVGGIFGLLLGMSSMMNLHYFAGFNGFLFLPALYVTVTIHELGHLLAGRIVGMRPGAIVIGGIVIFKSGERWLIRFNFRRMFSGGLAKLLPQKDDFRPASFGWMIAGGPFAGLAFIAIREERYNDALRFLVSARARIERLKVDSGLARFAKEKLAEYKEMCESATRAITLTSRDNFL